MKPLAAFSCSWCVVTFTPTGAMRMSQFLDWVAANTTPDPNGKVMFSHLYSGYKATLPKNVAFTKADALKELGARVKDLGRKDQPVKYVVGVSFAILESPPVNRVLESKILSLRKFFVYRYK